MNVEEIIREVEATYESQDIDRVLQLFDPEVVVYIGGKKSLEGLDELRKWHEGWLPGYKNYKLRKTVRAASGDTIAVEWHATYTKDDGTIGGSRGGNFGKCATIVC